MPDPRAPSVDEQAGGFGADAAAAGEASTVPSPAQPQEEQGQQQRLHVEQQQEAAEERSAEGQDQGVQGAGGSQELRPLQSQDTLDLGGLEVGVWVLKSLTDV